MEPIISTGALKALVKIFVAGAAAYQAHQKPGFDGEDIAAIQAFIEAIDATGAATTRGEKSPSRMAAVHTALIVQSFGAAFDEHWASNKRMAPDLGKPSLGRRIARFFTEDAETQQRREELDGRLRYALDTLTEQIQRKSAPTSFHFLRGQTSNPLATPVYNALWEAFTGSLLADDEPLIVLSRPSAKLEFEGHVHLAYLQALSSPTGRDLGAYLLQLEKIERPMRLRGLLAEDMAISNQRHVFGTTTPGVPMMPLGLMYVEPYGIWVRDREEQEHTPIRTLVQSLLEQHKIVLVRGDFGMGKSLTARMLAWKWASDYVLDAEHPSPEQVFPVFIKCVRDFQHSSFEDTVREALRNQAAAIGIELQRKDPAFDMPPDTMRVVYLVDGLDEVVLSGGEQERFFNDLKGATSDRHRIIVFSRPGALLPKEKLGEIPIVDVRPFVANEKDGGQVGEWLGKWNNISNNPELGIESLQKANLFELAVTPILLFMIAFTWEPDRIERGEIDRASIYGRFFQQIARGKCAEDRDRNPHVDEASKKLWEKLIELEYIEDKSPREEAMLWLMVRAAWEYRRCEERGEVLDAHDLGTILREELKLKGDMQSLELIRVGLLLVLQTDLRGESDQILFGHKSFLEYLVARYWAGKLRRIVAASESKRRKLERDLLGARLVAEDDRSIEFLMEIVHENAFDEQARRGLAAWAESCFKDERPDFLGNDADEQSWREDRRPLLRHAALSIRCRLQGVEPFSVMTAPLRSLLAWFWMRQKNAMLDAPGLVAKEINIVGADLRGANLFRADLRGANLEGANLVRANLVRANLVRANLVRADLRGANLEGANLEEANLEGANLEGEDLRGANLEGANLKWANLEGANLEGANPKWANLVRANLVRADLRGANLKWANLVRANLVNATHSRFTIWPKGFDPALVGAIQVDRKTSEDDDDDR